MIRATRHNPLTGKDDVFEAEPLTLNERREYDRLRRTPCEELDRTEPGWEARFNALALRAADESAARKIAAGEFCRQCGAIYGDCDCPRT